MNEPEKNTDAGSVALNEKLERGRREAFEKWISAEPLPELLARVDWMQAAFNAFEAGMEHENKVCAEIADTAAHKLGGYQFAARAIRKRYNK